MSTPDRYAVAYEEAVQALAHRATRAGVPDADEFAREFLQALARRGWRAYAPVTVLPTPPRDAGPMPADLYAETKARLRAARPASEGRDRPAVEGDVQ